MTGDDATVVWLKVYQSGRLVFCDHIFNGYGNARRDFQKQLAATHKAAIMGQTLPKDFKFRSVYYCAQDNARE